MQLIYRRASFFVYGISFLACLTACGENRRYLVQQRIDAATSGFDEASLVQAAVARGQAALEREDAPSVLDRVALRAQDLSTNNMSNGEEIRFSARLQMRNPWEVASERRAREAETDIAISKIHAASLEARVDLCRQASDAAAYDAMQEFYAWYRDQLQRTLAWNSERRSANTIDELRAERLELEGAIGLTKRAPRPVAGRPNSAYPLPDVSAPSARLVVAPSLILQTIQENQPDVAGLQATSRRYNALAQRARRRRLPWLGFLGVGYEIDQHNSASNIAGQVAVEIPFGLDQAAESRRYGALYRGEALEAEARQEELARQALAALEEIAFFDNQADQLQKLLTIAERARLLAARWLNDRLGEPMRVANLLDEAYGARDAVIAARHRAGHAGCTLLQTTGVAVSQWPRR